MPWTDKRKQRLWWKEARRYCRRQHICITCLKRKMISGKKLCIVCQNAGREYSRKLKERVISGYGGKCKCCGERRYEFLSVDHVKERGVDERRRKGVGFRSRTLYRFLIEKGFPTSHQILCYNCNLSIGFLGYCPHDPAKIRRVARREK